MYGEKLEPLQVLKQIPIAGKKKGNHRCRQVVSFQILMSSEISENLRQVN